MAKLSTENRLNRKIGFSHVLEAEKIKAGQVRIFFVRNQQRKARLGVVVSKKHFPTSVERNHLKRVVRELFRQHEIKFCSLDLVVFVNPAPNAGVVGKLKVLFDEIHIKCVNFSLS